MNLISILLIVPLATAFFAFVLRKEQIRNLIVVIGSAATIVLSIVVACMYFKSGLQVKMPEGEVVDFVIMGLEILLAFYIIDTGIRNKKYLVAIFAGIQTPLIVWFELTQKTSIEVETGLIFDKLSGIMVLIVGIVGGLICIYAVGYMKWYHEVHNKYQERKGFFFGVLLIFLSAMMGLVLSNHLMWIYFCWEITSFCSFLLIGYTKTPEAKNNAFRALVMNVGGGLCFAIAIVFIGMKYQTLELSVFVQMKPAAMVMIPTFFLAMAALTKSAQLPFSSWLLGAMVAPTPSSALLHSATMVKAGVYLLIRMAPLLGNTSVGKMVTYVGAVTFIMCSLMAISQQDAKKVLAYSTIANLGLIVICAGGGTKESIWAAILLIVFHAVSKSLLFLVVGSTEHQLGNRNVENMDILLQISKRLSIAMLIGIAGMFLAPFGMLISKWVAMKAFIDSNNLIIVIILAYGSAVTLFYWTKWMGIIVSNVKMKDEKKKEKIYLQEEFPIFILAGLVIISCLGFPLISKFGLVPYLSSVFGGAIHSPISGNDVSIMLFMLSMLIILPIGFIPAVKNDKRKILPKYMGGGNVSERMFDSIGNQKRQVVLHNWYMEEYFGSDKLTVWSNLLSILVMSIGLILMIWGVAK